MAATLQHKLFLFSFKSYESLIISSVFEKFWNVFEDISIQYGKNKGNLRNPGNIMGLAWPYLK